MGKNILNIASLIFLSFGVIAIFLRKDILKGKASKVINTTSGFVVSLISLLVVYILNR